MREWFGGDENLEEIIGLEELNVSNVTNMSGMFYTNKKIKKLDLSLWNISNVVDTTNLFYNLMNLEELRMDSAVVNVNEYTGMFFNISQNTKIYLKDADAAQWVKTRLSDVNANAKIYYKINNEWSEYI